MCTSHVCSPHCQVRSGPRGLQRTNKDLVDGLSYALYNRLRWSQRPEDIANLAVYLLQTKQYFKLQAHLSSVFAKSERQIIEDIFRVSH